MEWLQQLETIDAGTLEVPLCVLRLEKKTDQLAAAGLRTVGAVLARYRKGDLWRIPSIGRRTVAEVERRLALLPAVIRPGDGTIDWQSFAVACGCSLVPGHDVRSGGEFLAAFPEVIDVIIRSTENPVEQLVLTERLMRQPQVRLTLDEIGKRAQSRPISRERVRQLERSVIEGLSAALLFDDYGGLPFHFRDSFSTFWKRAAGQFADKSEISFAEFIETLESVWGVTAAELFPHLPLITAVLTSRATIPHQLREGMKLDARLHAEIGPALASRSIGWLALGKVADELLQDGIETIGGLIEAARSGDLPADSSKAGQVCRRALHALAEGLRTDGTMDWARYGHELGLRPVPAVDRSSPEEFLRHVDSDLEEVARTNATSMRAAEIFRLRTCLPQEQRRTLQEVADLLGSHGPSIKREESVLLDSLHAQLVTQDFLYSRVLFPRAFLGWWRKAWNVYQGSRSSYLAFCAALAREWDLPLNSVHDSAEALWAVFARYPNGRRSPARRTRRRVSQKGFTGGTIVLRGFRRAH